MRILLGILSVFTFHKAQTLLQWVRNGMVIWNGARGSTETAKSGEGDLKPKHGLTAVLPLASITPQQEAVKILRGQKKSGIGYRSRTVQRGVRSVQLPVRFSKAKNIVYLLPMTNGPQHQYGVWQYQNVV